MNPLTYLATPYTYKHPSELIRRKVQEIRFETCSRAAGYLMNEFGWNVFSPITHSHPIHLLYPAIRGDWPFWEKIDTEFLQLSCRIVILTIPGWKTSTGVTAETKIARDLGLQIQYLRTDNDGFVLTDLPVNTHSEFITL